MVLEVLADAGKVDQRFDTGFAQHTGRPHARELQKLRRVDRTPAQDHLAGPGLGESPAPPVLHTDGAGSLEEDPGDMGPGHDPQVGAVHYRVQVRAGRRQPPSAVDVAIEGVEPLLPVPVHVVSQGMARLLHGL